MALNQLRSDQLLSGSLYPITSSWALRAVSASISTTSSYVSPTFISASAAASGFGTGGGGGTSLITGSTYPITSSWAQTSSYAINGGTTLVTGSIYPITSSWAFNAVSASYLTTGTGPMGYLINTSSIVSAVLTSSTQQFVSDGVTSTYGLNEISKSATDLLIFVNGIGQRPTSSYEVISQSIVKFNSIPVSGSNVEIRYFSSALRISFATSSLGAEYYTGNAVSTNYLLTNQYVTNDYDIIVSLDGLIQKPTNDYVVTFGNILTFNVPPPADVDIEVRYLVVTTTAYDISPRATAPTILSGSNIDWLINDNYEKQVSQSETYTFSNILSGKSLVFILANTGSSTVIPIFPSTVKWSAAISPQGTLSSYVSVYTFYKSNYYILGNCVENYL
jgi:hypothetical protein